MWVRHEFTAGSDYSPFTNCCDNVAFRCRFVQITGCSCELFNLDTKVIQNNGTDIATLCQQVSYDEADLFERRAFPNEEYFRKKSNSKPSAMTEDNPTIVLVDDDESLNQLVEEYLHGQGFNVIAINDGLAAAAGIIEHNPDLVILDVMLPGADGLSICRQVRPQYDGPILMLTALGDDIDEVAGLETGADDYLAKPVRPRVLLARIRALLRRYERPVPAKSDVYTSAGNSDRDITIGGVSISKSSMTVSSNGKIINLTDAEFDLLYLLASHAGQLLSRDEINRELRGLEHDGLDRTIDLRISRLRKKLGDDSREPQIIKSVRGKGYLYAL